MSANLYAWTDDSKLHPMMEGFADAYDDALGRGDRPDPRLQTFVRALLEVYPDLDIMPEGEEVDTVWAAGPLENEIVGKFLNVAIVWSRIDEAMPIFLQIAREQGLHAYDPQSEKHYPPR